MQEIEIDEHAYTLIRFHLTIKCTQNICTGENANYSHGVHIRWLFYYGIDEEARTSACVARYSIQTKMEHTENRDKDRNIIRYSSSKCVNTITVLNLYALICRKAKSKIPRGASPINCFNTVNQKDLRNIRPLAKSSNGIIPTGLLKHHICIRISILTCIHLFAF